MNPMKSFWQSQSRKALAAFALAMAALLPLGASSSANEKAAPAVEKTVKAAVEGWLKNQYKVESVLKTPMLGIVEVRIGNDLFYVDEKGSFAIIEGQMVNLKTGENITAARVEDISRIDFAKLPKDLAMKTVRGNGKRVMAVFEDPYCSYCRTYRKTLTEMSNVTIYTFFYPMLRAESETVARNAWCAKNREEVWNDWMLFGKEPPKAPVDCKFDSARILEIGKQLSVSGTPTTFLADGRRMSGAVPKDRLEKMLGEQK